MTTQALTVEVIFDFVAGIWSSPQNGTIWYFSFNRGTEYSTCLLKQNISTSVPVQFRYKITYETGHFYLHLDETETKIVSINPSELILEPNISAPFKLIKKSKN